MKEIFTVGTTPDDKYAVYQDEALVMIFDDERHPGEAEPNKTRAETTARLLNAFREFLRSFE